MSNLKPWFANPDPSRPEAVAFPQASVTHPDAKLSGPIPGRYEDTVATKSPGAGELKPFSKGTAIPSNSHSSSSPPLSSTANPPSLAGQKGKRGKGTQLRGPRTIVP